MLYPMRCGLTRLLLVGTGNNVIPHPHACLDTETYVLVSTKGTQGVNTYSSGTREESSFLSYLLAITDKKCI